MVVDATNRPNAKETTMAQQSETLEAAYTNAHLAAVQMCERISQLLFDLPAPDSDVAITWGHVGDLDEINRHLKNALDFLNRPNS